MNGAASHAMSRQSMPKHISTKQMNQLVYLDKGRIA